MSKFFLYSLHRGICVTPPLSLEISSFTNEFFFQTIICLVRLLVYIWQSNNQILVTSANFENDVSDNDGHIFNFI